MSDRAPASWGLALQMSEREDEWVIRADLPQIQPSDINLFVSNEGLSITAPSSSPMGFGGPGFLRAERRLPAGVFTEDIKASFQEGVLEISLPKSQEPMRRVPIESGSECLA